jgi:hypothetical protein
MTNIPGSGSISQRHGSADPDPDMYQNVMDPQHCPKVRQVKHFYFYDKNRRYQVPQLTQTSLNKKVFLLPLANCIQNQEGKIAHKKRKIEKVHV